MLFTKGSPVTSPPKSTRPSLDGSKSSPPSHNAPGWAGVVSSSHVVPFHAQVPLRPRLGWSIRQTICQRPPGSRVWARCGKQLGPGFRYAIPFPCVCENTRITAVAAEHLNRAVHRIVSHPCACLSDGDAAGASSCHPSRQIHVSPYVIPGCSPPFPPPNRRLPSISGL